MLTKDYAIDAAAGQVTFHTPPENGTEINAEYIYWVPTTDRFRRFVNLILRTGKPRALLVQAETDGNGTLSFDNSGTAPIGQVYFGEVYL